MFFLIIQPGWYFSITVVKNKVRQTLRNPFSSIPRLNNGQLGGGNVKSIDIGGKTGEGLLGSVRAKEYMLAFNPSIYSQTSKNIPDKSVDLDGVNIVQLLKSLLDLALVGLDVDDEDEGVVLLDLLHGALSVQGVQNNLVEVQSGAVVDRDTGVLGGPRQLEGLGAVEGGRGADLAGLVKLLPQPR